jgi:carboxyvinyl-carboxyphosphonate phosphorylmutase
MTRWQKRREQFRRHLDGDKCLFPATVFDPASVRIAAHLGFECGMVAGSVASFAVLGAPDLIVLTLSEFAGLIRRLSRAADLPLMADADHGYGSALNVVRTVEELEIAGAAGLSIEDTDLPAGHGAAGKPGLIPLEEGTAKMRAALAARSDQNLVIAGRTSAAAITGLNDARERVLAYQAAGVDAIFLTGLKTLGELDALVAEIDLPVILGDVAPALHDGDLLAARGVRLCIRGHQAHLAAVRAVHDTLKALRDGTRPQDLEHLAPQELMDLVLDTRGYKRAIKDYLS